MGTEALVAGYWNSWIYTHKNEICANYGQSLYI